MRSEDKKESLYSREWLKKGDDDISAAEALLAVNKTGPASFHIQQALEKYLKGYLLSKGWRLLRIHDLEKLLDDAIKLNPQFEDYRELCRTVSEYYIEERYPFNISSELTMAELEAILKQVKIFMSKLSGDIERRPIDGEDKQV